MLTTIMIGNKIAEARKKINVSQAQLAQRLFISSQAVGKWERGESMPDIITFNRLAEILGVDLNYFSESFQSETTEMAPVESMDRQSDELPSGMQNLPAGKTGKKLNWDMSRGNWVDADFSGLKNLHERFSSSNMQRCKFIGSDMSGLLLKSNNVDSCDFSGSDISSSHIQSSNLGNNIFKDCSLKETEFSESNINGCDFSGADLTGATFKSSNFQKNTMANAIWKRTSFIGMAIDDIIFDGTLEDCYFENCAFYRVTFQNVTITNTFFKNKSLKRIRFIDCQADRLTYAFLKNGRADLTGITLLTS
ncbi:MAG: pentapeptide repeat-containing protein [Bacteroidales bacterium]